MNFKRVFHLWEINSDGVIRNRRTRKILKLRLRRDGYLDVKLSYKRYLIHRLVAIAFLPNPNNFPQVNHIDGDRKNPKVTNLEWCDQFANMKHAIKTGLFPNRQGERNGRATITYKIAEEIRAALAKGISVQQIAENFNTTTYIVYNIKRGLTWKKQEKGCA